MKPIPHMIPKIGLTACAVALLATGAVFGPQAWIAAHAQGRGGAAAPVDPALHATVSDPPGMPPDPTHIPIILPKDIKWTGQEGRSQQAVLWGDPNTPGSPYGVLMKWYPGNFSRPHFHVAPRWIYVVSGTWWVSSSNVYNEKLTYPVQAGSFVQDMIKTVHWDGDRTGDKEPTVLLIAGVGPAANTPVDENGNPMPGRDGAGRAGNAAGSTNNANSPPAAGR